MSAPQKVLELVDLFRRNADAYHGPEYNETQTRQEFINPLFKCLGWDMDNEQGYAEAYKDVIHEAAIKIGGATKAPDYCFRIGGVPKFFLEAKRPSVNIKDDSAPAYQLRRYAWTGKLALSVLTDFEEFAVYDCRIKPAHTDKAGVARVLYLRYDEYPQRWDEIAGVFTREAILKGSFDKFAESNKAKRGTATVDAAFLQEIESWRDLLARNLALRNPRLSQRELNFAVQVTIDRIIFLRMCEDRGIESYGQLQKLLQEPDTYTNLLELYRKADDRYNSGLFHFHAEKGRPEAPDTLTPSLTLDDKPLKDILRGLYYPECPYEFSVLSGEILGQVYEQFLGKVIRLTAGHRAVVEDKPEVRKAGGVYYTPSYIVQQTVGKLLEGKTPKQAARLRILDPACGSGSFLLGAYQRLLDWHRDRYLEDRPKKHTKELYQGTGGVWRLTTAEKKRILLDNIDGVDIDPQAVEVTKLSLLLKVLEGESEQTLQSQLRLFHERALPDLSSNIQCGNSLIGPDFYDGRQLSMFGEEERYRINVFDWEAAFPWLREAGGFDVVIGNPPYVRQESLRELKAYLKRQYKTYESTADLYVYFIERAISLLRSGGLFSFIVSSSFLRTNFGRPLRGFIAESAAILELVDFGGLAVFAAAKDTYVCIPLIGKQKQPDSVSVCKIASLDALDLPSYVKANCYPVPTARFSPEGWSTAEEKSSRIFDKLMSGAIPLGKYVDNKIFLGIKTGLNEAFEIDSQTYRQFIAECPEYGALIHPFLGGQDIRRYCVRNTEQYLIAIPCGWTRQTMESERKKPTVFSEREAWNWFAERYPPLASHLLPFAEAAKSRQDQGEYWWELRPCDYYSVLGGAKIIYPDIAKQPRFHLDTNGTFIRNTAYCLGTADPYLLGVLNSRLMWFAISRISIPFGTRAGEYRYRLFTQYIEQLPIRPTDPADKTAKTQHETMIVMVNQQLSLHKQLAAAKTPQEQTVLQRQIDAMDRQIDQLVYELYGLTDAEIQIVEAAKP
ncbi:MAG TPA: DNA methyltransferase [Gemmataceae bacterium]